MNLLSPDNSNRFTAMSQYQKQSNISTHTLSALCFVQDTPGGLEQEMIRHYHHCPPQYPRSEFSIYCKPKPLTFYLHITHIQNYILPSVLGLSLGLPLSTSQSTHFFTHAFSVDDQLNDECIVCSD